MSIHRLFQSSLKMAPPPWRPSITAQSSSSSFIHRSLPYRLIRLHLGSICVFILATGRFCFLFSSLSMRHNPENITDLRLFTDLWLKCGGSKERRERKKKRKKENEFKLKDIRENKEGRKRRYGASGGQR